MSSRFFGATDPPNAPSVHDDDDSGGGDGDDDADDAMLSTFLAVTQRRRPGPLLHATPASRSAVVPGCCGLVEALEALGECYALGS